MELTSDGLVDCLHMTNEAPSASESLPTTNLALDQAALEGPLPLVHDDAEAYSQGTEIEPEASYDHELASKFEVLETPEAALTETSSAASDVISVERQNDPAIESELKAALNAEIGGVNRTGKELTSPVIGRRGLFLKKRISEESKVPGRSTFERIGSLSPKKKPILRKEKDSTQELSPSKSMRLSGSPEVQSEASKLMETARQRNSSKGPTLSKEIAGPATSKASAKSIKKKSGKDIGAAPSACASCLLY
jgi:hypothetical protein